MTKSESPSPTPVRQVLDKQTVKRRNREFISAFQADGDEQINRQCRVKLFGKFRSLLISVAMMPSIKASTIGESKLTVKSCSPIFERLV
jgi:hypothetical protein